MNIFTIELKYKKYDIKLLLDALKSFFNRKTPFFKRASTSVRYQCSAILNTLVILVISEDLKLSLFQLCNYRESFRNRKALVITETELKLIAKAATIGESNKPKIGNKTPAAMGTPNTLYTKAKKRFCLIFLTTA